jgi:hydrogenase expression/formation protein HypC
MCLAIPAEVLDTDEDTALVDLDGVRQRVCTAMLEGVVPGDFVVVHVGYALSKLDKAEADRALAALKRLGEPQTQPEDAP